MFCNEIARRKGITLGRFDSRDATFQPAGLPLLYNWIDASLYRVIPSYIQAINSYFVETFEISQELLPYTVFNEEICRKWNWRKNGEEAGCIASNAIDDTRVPLSQSPVMKIFSASSLFDFGLPYFGQELSIYRLLLPKLIQNNITMKRYYGEHMMYTDIEFKRALLEDLASFITNTGPNRSCLQNTFDCEKKSRDEAELLSL